jgi:integrase
MAVKQLPDGRWICYYRNPITKKQKREYFGRGVEAETRARNRNDELGLLKRRPARKHYGPTFSQLGDLYYKKKGFDRKPRETLSYRLDNNIYPAIGHLYATRITQNDMEDYVDHRRKDGVSDSSIAREITDIKAILNWSTRRKPPLIPINPVRDFKAPAEKNEVILPPDQDEIAAIYKHACPHLQRFITLASFLGCRPGATELLSLTWTSVSFQWQSIRVMSADKGGPPFRQVPIHELLHEQLKNWHAADKKYFEGRNAKKRKTVKTMHIVHYWGSPVKSIKRAWRSALEGANITRRIRPYDLRHRFVTKALENGADIKALSDIVGSRPETLQKYYQHVTKELHRKTINQAASLDIQIITDIN